MRRVRSARRAGRHCSRSWAGRGRAGGMEPADRAIKEPVQELTVQISGLSQKLQGARTRFNKESAGRAHAESSSAETAAALRDARRRIDELNVDLRFAEEAG